MIDCQVRFKSQPQKGTKELVQNRER